MCFYVAIILYVHTLMLMPTSRLVFMIFSRSPFKDLRLKCISSSQPSMATSHSATIPGSACRLQSSWTKSGQPTEIIKRQWFTMQLRYIEVVNFSTLLWSLRHWPPRRNRKASPSLPCICQSIKGGGQPQVCTTTAPELFSNQEGQFQKLWESCFFFGVSFV